MNHSNSASQPPTPRVTLKLKPGVRKSPREKRQPLPRQEDLAKLKPGARWSDEFNERMQADMDALMFR
jgi:hypothetical protein